MRIRIRTAIQTARRIKETRIRIRKIRKMPVNRTSKFKIVDIQETG